MPQNKVPNRRVLLARADVRIYQCLVIDSKFQRRNVLVWHCGEDIFYSSTMEGLFDPARRRVAPEWLKAGLNKPEDFTVLLTHRTDERYPADSKNLPNVPSSRVRSVPHPVGEVDLDLDEDGVKQG